MPGTATCALPGSTSSAAFPSFRAARCAATGLCSAASHPGNPGRRPIPGSGAIIRTIMPLCSMLAPHSSPALTPLPSSFKTSSLAFVLSAKDLSCPRFRRRASKFYKLCEICPRFPLNNRGINAISIRVHHQHRTGMSNSLRAPLAAGGGVW